MRHFIKGFLLLAVMLVMTSQVWPDEDLNGSVVKIYTVFNSYDYDRPWQMVGQDSCSGSGCIISGKRILTNAHVVADQTFIQVKKAGDARKYTAKVEVVAHESDLALLRVEDETFFAGVSPIKIGNLASVRDRVAVYGFPEGGDELCITEGVVSRIEHSIYSHSFAKLLACQIDAAINGGNSGGPVIKGSRLVGVAFQSMSGGDVENIGYMVPAPVVKHFLLDISDGRYDGIPELGIYTQKMENPDIRLKYGMADTQTGVLVRKIDPDSPARGILQPEDVIMAMDGVDVESDRTVEFRRGERTDLSYLFQRKQINDSITVEILRQGKVSKIDLSLSKSSQFSRLVPYEQYDMAPTYCIVGGLVFQPLTVNYLKTWGAKWVFDAPDNLANHYFYKRRTDDRREIIVLTQVLADEHNVGYHDLKNRVILQVNDRKISTMNDLVAAFENNDGKYHIIVDERGHQIALDRHNVNLQSESILKRYRINSDRSQDLRTVVANVAHELGPKYVRKATDDR